MKYIVAFITISFVLGVSCRPTKKITTAISKKDTAQVVLIDSLKRDSMAFIHNLLDHLEKNRIDYKTFSAKIKVDYTDKDGKGPELTVFARMIKDSAIWLSINATLFSYEAFRVLITPDSVKVLNRKDKIVQYRSVSYLQELSQLPFDFSTLQDLIIGNPIYVDTNIIFYRKNGGNISLLSSGQFFKNLITVAGHNYLILHSKLDDADATRNRTCDLTYTNYENKTGVNFATLRKISVSEKSKIDIDMDFKQYAFNEVLTLPFSIPKNYTVK
jgi:hypothetical protein